MYRILLSTPNFSKDFYSFYKKTITITDENTGDETIRTVPYETDDLTELQTEYLKVIEKYPTASVLPVDMLETVLDVLITDTTN